MTKTKLKLEGSYKPKLEGALKRMNFFTEDRAFYNIAKSKIGYSSNKAQVPDMVSDYLQNLYTNHSELNKLLETARRQTTNFFEQFPTPEKIKAILLTDKPFKMALELKHLTEEVWPKTKEQSTKKWLDKLAAEMKNADAQVTQAFSNKNDHAFIAKTVKHVDFWVLKIYGPLLSVVEIMYPDPARSPDAKALSQSQKSMHQQATTLQKDLRLYTNIIAKLSKDSAIELARLAKERLDNSHFPKGKDLSSADKNTMIKLLEPIFATKILRTAINKDWESQTEVLFIGNRAVIKTYNYFSLWVAYQFNQEKYQYTLITLRRAKTGNGRWGDIKYVGIGHQWTREIRKGNINK